MVVFIYNQAALNMTIRGWSPKEDATVVLHDIWLRLACLGVAAFWAYVPSKLNLADGPSREDFGTVEELGLRRVAAV